jgi:hypothetical protein
MKAQSFLLHRHFLQKMTHLSYQSKFRSGSVFIFRVAQPLRLQSLNGDVFSRQQAFGQLRPDVERFSLSSICFGGLKLNCWRDFLRSRQNSFFQSLTPQP